jgi:type II secretory ATPase GspE/PulE/Tfp pilus assembly ATPase PilB-like protein
MDAATWLKQLGDPAGQNDRRARLAELTNYLTHVASLDDLLFAAMERVSTFMGAKHAALFLPDAQGQLRAVCWAGDAVRELELPSDLGNAVGFACAAKGPIALRNLADPAELARLHPRLRPDDRFNHWLGEPIATAILSPLLAVNGCLGVLLVANRTAESGFVPRDLIYAGDIARAIASAVANLLQNPVETAVPPPVTPAPVRTPSPVTPAPARTPSPVTPPRTPASLTSAAPPPVKKATPEPRQDGKPDPAPRSSERPKRGRWDYLLEASVLPPEVLTKALTSAESTDVDPARFLIEKQGVNRADVEKSLSLYFNAPFYRFQAKQVIPDDLKARLRVDFLRKMGAVPIERRGAQLIIVIDDPTDFNRCDGLRSIESDREVVFHVGFKDEIIACIEASYGVRPDVNVLLKELSTDEGTGAIDEPSDDEDEEGEADSAIIKLANQIIIDAFQRGASDIHIEPYGKEDNTRIRFRIDGDCVRYQDIPPAFRHPLVARFKIMAKLDISERRKPQDGKIKFRMRDRTIELRVATLPTVNGNEDIVMRILAASKPIPLDEMGMATRNLTELRALLAKPYGLILCVGPTGSGKTTTLHSALGSINTTDMKIWTAEDPVEITQAGLRQVQVQPKIGFDFAAAMRAFLRADPDVIMVGEMRDKETASTGVEASLTGHLVFSTLHTNSAPETITRLIDMGLDPFSFADALLGVLAQRLTRGLCKKCKEEYVAEKSEVDEIRQAFGEEEADRRGYVEGTLKLWRGTGCEVCGKSGYKGRIAVHELLVNDDRIKLAIAKRAPVEEVRDLAIGGGMTTLLQDGIEKAVAGKTDLKQVLAVCLR